MGKLRPILLAVLVLSTISSCVETQDFDQYDDLSVTPTYAASLLYFESPEDVINGLPGVFYTEEFVFEAFNGTFFSERVLDGVITYQIENTTSKQFDLTLEYLDESGNVLDTENFMIDPAPTAIIQREVAYGGFTGRNIDIIRNTAGIRVTAENLGDNTSVSNLPDPMIILRSSAQFRIRLK